MPSAAAAAAGFALTPEIVAVLSATSTAGGHRSIDEVSTDSGSFSESFSHRSTVGYAFGTRC